MEGIRINNYVIKYEVNALDKFNLTHYDYRANVITKELSKEKTPSTLAYGITLSRAFRIIATREVDSKEINDLAKYMEAYEERLNSLYAKFDKFNKEVYKFLKENKNGKDNT
jgi:cytochrome c peroxidase